MAREAAVCDKAEQIGRLDIAEEKCEQALGDVNEDVLEPAVKSERLYRLGRIKRQTGKFVEADKLLRQSLAIEETLSGPGSAATGQRLLELSLILAGEERWEDGARVLEEALTIAGQLTAKERTATRNILRRYAAKLHKIEQAEVAARLEAAAVGLSDE